MRLMILGAGGEHVHLIRQAKGAGHYLVVVDPDENRPGVALGDEYLPLDLMMTEAIMAAARQQKIDGVTTASLGLGMRTVGAVAEALNLPGLRRESAYLVTDKIAMRQRLAQTGVDSVPFNVADSVEMAQKTVVDLGLPVVVKPPDGSGSRGVLVAHTHQDVPAAYRQAAKQVRSPERRGLVLIESLIDGREISGEGFVYRGKLTLTTLRDKIMTPLPYRQEIGYSFPPMIDKDQWEKVRRFIEIVAKNLGLESVPFQVDLFLLPGDRLALIEIAARLPGYGLVTDFLPFATGIDLTHVNIALALGQSPRMPTQRSIPTCMIILQPARGILRGGVPLTELRQQPYVVAAQSELQPGDTIDTVTDGAAALHYGYVVTTGSDVESARHHAEQACQWFYGQLEYL